MSESRHLTQARNIRVDYQMLEHSALLRIRSSQYLDFRLIAVNPEDAAIIVVNSNAVVHNVLICVYQFHCILLLLLYN